MSSIKSDSSKFNSSLSPDSSLFKFLAKGLSPTHMQKLMFLRSCRSKKDIHPNRTILNKSDRLLILISKTLSNFFELLKESIKACDENDTFSQYLVIFEEYIQSKFKHPRNMKAESEKAIKIILDNNERNKIKFQRLNRQLIRRITEFNEWCNMRRSKAQAINRRQHKFRDFIANKIEDDLYDGNMRIVSKTKMRKDAEQNSILLGKTTRDEYQNLLDRNLVNQKSLVEQKLKAEQTLRSILLKFDSNVGSRVAEIESIEGDINKNKKCFENWKLLIAQQEASFVSLMKEKEEEELKIRNEKLEELRINHAAKVIQISWKKYKVKKRKVKNQNKAKHLKNNTPKRTR